MPTTQAGFYYPDAGSPLSLETLMAAAATSQQDVYDSTRAILAPITDLNDLASYPTGDLRIGDVITVNALQAMFGWTGSSWVQLTTAKFATRASLDTEYAKASAAYRVNGAMARVTTEYFDRQRQNSIWNPVGPPRSLLVPGSVGGTGVTTSDGVTTITGASATVALISGLLNSAHGFERYLIEYDLTTSAAAGINLLMDLAGSPSVADYDNQRDTSISTTVATVRTAANSAAQVDVISVAGARHRGQIILRNPATAVSTEFWNDYTVMDAAYGVTSGAGYTRGRHDVATAYDGFRLQAVSGDLSGTIKVYGLL